MNPIKNIDIKNRRGLAHFQASGLPQTGVIVLAGKNGAGKSTVIDCIESFFPGAGIPPVKNGETDGPIHIELHGGETWTRNASGDVEVVVPGAGSLKRPSDHFKALLSGLGIAEIDPGRFMTMQPRERRAKGQALIGLDLTPYDEKIARAREASKELEADLKALQNRNAGMTPVAGVPEQEVDVAALTAALQQDLDHNAKWQRLTDQCEASKREATQLRTEIARLSERLKQVDDAIETAEAELEKSGFVDVTNLRTQIDDAEATNKNVRYNLQIAAARDEWNEKEPERAKLAKELKDAEEAKRSALASADFPIEGMAFDETDITLNGIPWSDLSDGEQRLLSSRLAIVGSQSDCPVRFFDGNDLDPEARQTLYAEIEERGLQALMMLSDENAQEGDLVIRIKDGVSE